MINPKGFNLNFFVKTLQQEVYCFVIDYLLLMTIASNCSWSSSEIFSFDMALMRRKTYCKKINN